MRTLKYIAIWLVALLLYGGFWGWFFKPWQPPLSDAEITTYLKSYRALYPEGNTSKIQIRLRGFLAGDAGKEVYTLHLVRMRAEPQGIKPSATYVSVFDILSRWTEPKVWHLYWRAGYPVAVAPATSDTLSRWGVETDEAWTHLLLVRHRSRRDLMEVLLAPPAAQPPLAQSLLISAIETQFTLALAPMTMMLMLDPTFIAGLLFFALAVLAHLAVLFQEWRLTSLTTKEDVVVKDGTD